MDYEFEGLYGFHGHTCPMSTMGARLGLAAMRALGVTKADQFRMSGHYRAKNCALDGVQFVTGCTLGNGNLSFEDAGLASFTLSMKDGGPRATAVISVTAQKRFRAHREKRDAAGPGGGDEAAAEELRRGFEALIEWVQTAPDRELLDLEIG